MAVPQDHDGLARRGVRREVCYPAPEGPDRHDHSDTLEGDASICQEDLCTSRLSPVGGASTSDAVRQALSSISFLISEGRRGAVITARSNEFAQDA